MNRQLSALDRFSLISNSDCHSPAKLGREANIFATSFDYYSLRTSLEQKNGGLAGTIEFFPREGKYYAAGHRRCGFRGEESTTETTLPPCPVCRRPLTAGVSHRVRLLADLTAPLFPSSAPAVHHLVPLAEIIAEITGRGANTKTVRDFYVAAVNRLGPELPLLLDTPAAEIAGFSGPLATAIDRMRRGQVEEESGFDGQPGRIRLLPDSQ
jgi:PHP family Zn ribbon phosphoesterase